MKRKELGFRPSGGGVGLEGLGLAVDLAIGAVPIMYSPMVIEQYSSLGRSFVAAGEFVAIYILGIAQLHF